MVVLPPTTLPRGQVSERSRREGSGSVRNRQSYRELPSVKILPAGTRCIGDQSEPPASRTSTDQGPSFPSRFASTEPAAPAPTITKSYVPIFTMIASLTAICHAVLWRLPAERAIGSAYSLMFFFHSAPDTIVLISLLSGYCLATVRSSIEQIQWVKAFRV